MTYRRKNVTEPLNLYVEQELEQIEQTFAITDFFNLKKLHNEPLKLKEGLIVFADGSDWNPGSGQGIYAYYNASWNKLG